MNNGLIVREKWIDELKGVAIILVVLGHVLDGFIKSGFEYNGVTEIRVYDGIYIFHMPLFFAISGYVFAMVYLSPHSDWGGVIRIDRVKQYRSQICNLTAVYFIFSITFWGFKYIFHNYVHESMGGIDFVMIPIRRLPGTPLWYLYVLVILYIVMSFLLKLNCHKDIIIFVSFIVCILYQVLQIKEVITAQRTFYYLFFLCWDVCFA